MRKRLVDSYTDPATDIVYGLRGDPTDFALSQKYTHDHVAAVTRTLLTAGLVEPEVSGFAYTLAGGLSVSIAAGQAFDAAGNFYETITEPEGQPTVVTLDPADVANPRIDLIYLLLEPSVQAQALPRTFRRLRTPSELAANLAPYTPTNFTQFAEEHARATVRVHKGTPGAVPVAPALNANEVALYRVRVNANAATLVAGNVTDVRQKARSLAEAWAKLDGVAAGAQVNVLESVSGTAPIQVGAVAGKNQTISIAAATAGAAGSMSAADKTKLDAATEAATGNALVKRDANGDAGFRRITSTVVTGTPPLAVTSTTQVNNLNAQFVQGQDLAALDSRYVNAAGNENVMGWLELFSGGRAITGGARELLALTNNTTPYNGSPTAALKLGALFTSGGAPTPVAAVVGGKENAVDGDSNGFISLQTQLGASLYERLRISSGGHVQIGGSLGVGGGFTAGSKNFIIDHPLNPLNKDLVHGNVESAEYLLVYRVTTNLVSGTRELDLDEYFGLSIGTMAALVDDMKVYSVYSPGPDHVTAAYGGGTLVLNSANGADSSTVNVLLIGRRKDPYIRLDPWTDAQGLLVPEHDKVTTGADAAALVLETVTVEAGDARAGTAEKTLVSRLVGRAGFPRYPTVAGDGAEPTRTIAYAEAGWTQLGPAHAGFGTKSGAGDRSWVDPHRIQENIASEAEVTIGLLRDAESDYLEGRQYGFAPPAGSTPRMIVVEIKRRMRGAFTSVRDAGLHLIVGGVVQASVNKADTASDWSHGYFSVAQYVFEGADLGGLTAEQLADPDFGVALKVSLNFADEEEEPSSRAEVEEIKVTAYVEPGA